MLTFTDHLIEAKTTKYYYHVTFKTNARKIKSQGLKPFKTSNWAKGDGERYNEYAGVYAFSSPEDAWKWAFKMNWEFKKPISIMRLKKNKSWKKDPSADIMLQMGKGDAMMSQGIKASEVVDAIDISFEKPKDLSHGDWMKNNVKQLTEAKHKHDWTLITANNGHKTYSVTDRCKVCKKTRKVNPQNGKEQRR